MRTVITRSCVRSVRMTTASWHSRRLPRSVDDLVIEQARREQRILLTEDKDFGWLVYVRAAASIGVILIRFPASARVGLGAAISQLVRDHAGQIDGAFTVVEPGRVRISRLPGAPGT